MKFIRVTRIDDPLFTQLYELLQRVFPADEVLAFKAWEGPLNDEGLRVCVAASEGEVLGATEYRYYPDLNVAMTDFTIIGREGLGVGRFLYRMREADIAEWAERYGKTPLGMFAEIYDPYRAREHAFGGIKPMDPFVRREVLSHLGYKRLDFPYVHPSWKDSGEPVTELDLCFLPFDETIEAIPGELVATFLTEYYRILENKPPEWHAMIHGLGKHESIRLLPI